MSNTELDRVRSEMGSVGYSMTSFDKLGVDFDQTIADELCALADASEDSYAASEIVKYIVKNDMIIVQNPTCLEIGKRLVRPVVDALFSESKDPDFAKSWAIFGLNRYDKGGKFGVHQDNIGKTVLVITASGEREFTVYETPTPGMPDGTPFNTVEAVFTATPGSVLLLDPEKDPAHAVTATLSSSLVAVTDVPHLLRPLE